MTMMFHIRICGRYKNEIKLKRNREKNIFWVGPHWGPGLPSLVEPSRKDDSRAVYENFNAV